MSRYRALRQMRCDPLTAAVIAFLNFMTDVNPKEIRFMSVVIELDDLDQQQEQP